MTSNGTAPKHPAPRRSRAHELLLAAFVTGATLEQAARAAGVSPRTAARWKANPANRSELDAARADLVETALASVREALPAAAQGVAGAVRALGEAVPAAAKRLAEVVQDPEAETSVAIRASTELLANVHRFHALTFEVFARLAEQSATAARLDALEATVAAQAAARPTVRPYARPTLLADATN